MGQTFFFRINLNKFGEIKVQAEREKKTFRNAIIAYTLGFVVLVVLMVSVNSNLSKKVENRRQFLKQTEDQLKSFETGSDYLSNADLDKLSETFNNRIFWAKKMVALGNEITDKLAVSKLTFNNGILTLNGITPINSGVKELDLINEFINRLKANPEISNDFPQIKSGQINKQITKDTAILEFVIECYSRETQKKEAAK
ncbi:MAG TPA: hypothetical protein PL124_03770 [Candidatus Cloacimonadota bacterium]|nr:hypothetical protein [Candidatus Cloacimonadota bacterium]HPS38508.1 hypothetical protein [Candidatus Cloacimonadota bacterium]